MNRGRNDRTLQSALSRGPVLLARLILIAFVLTTPIVWADPFILRQANTTLKFPSEKPVGDLEFTLTAGIGEYNFDKPVALATPPGETNRIFIVERTGRVIIATNLSNSKPITNLFLDISDRVA